MPAQLLAPFVGTLETPAVDIPTEHRRSGAMLRLAHAVDREPRSQRSQGEYAGYRLIEYAGRFFGVPAFAGPICLVDESQRSQPWILSAAGLDELRDEIARHVAAGEGLRHVEDFGQHRIYAAHGKHYAIPREGEAGPERTFSGSSAPIPAAESLGQIRRLVLQSEQAVDVPGEVLGTFAGYALTEINGGVAAFPLGMQGAEHLSQVDQAAVGVLHAPTREALEAVIEGQRDPRPIEFTGWLPAFRRFGGCGTHPQFAHTDVPPEGYAFVQSPPPRLSTNPRILVKQLAGKALRGAKVGLAAARLFAQAASNGSPIGETLDFLRTRDMLSQLQLPRTNRLLFLTSVPYTLGQDPWVIEIEDIGSLLFPYVDNGKTSDLAIEQVPGFRALKTLLELPNCRAILTHVASTAAGIAKLFASETITRKTAHVPLGVRVPSEWQRHQRSSTVNLLFTNSWHQSPDSFYLRGGLDVLEAFFMVHAAYPELRLTLRTRLPGDLPARYHEIIDKCGVSVVDEFLTRSEFERLMVSSHAFLLPSARIHVVSVLQAMAYGLVPIVSDGWGLSEYVEHGRTGLVVRGRYGKVTWDDEQNGMLRENYAPMYRCDPEVTQNLIDALSQVAGEIALRRELGHSARREVQTRFSLARWNLGLKQVLDRAWSGD